MPSKSPSRARSRQQSKSPSRKLNKSFEISRGSVKQETKKRAQSRSPARGKGKAPSQPPPKPRSRSASRGRKNEESTTPRPRGRPKSQSRSLGETAPKGESKTAKEMRESVSAKNASTTKQAMENLSDGMTKISEGVGKLAQGVFSTHESRHKMAMTQQSHPIHREATNSFSIPLTAGAATLRRRVASLDRSTPLVRAAKQARPRQMLKIATMHLKTHQRLYAILALMLLIMLLLFCTRGTLHKSLTSLRSQMDRHLSTFKKQV